MARVEDFGIIPVDFGALANVFSSYKAPKDKVSNLAKTGKLIRLKKGLFVLSPEISGDLLSNELIANHLLGPSYISLESALSYYGLIPERVFSTRSVTTKRAKTFTTSLGIFEYVTIPHAHFPIGIKTEIIRDSFAFLIATPEKALCDLILTTSGLRLQSGKAMRSYLHEDLRINFSAISSWDAEIVEQCILKNKKKRELQLLNDFLDDERNF